MPSPRDILQSHICKLLDTFSFEGFSSVYIAFGVHGDIPDTEELPGLTSTHAEAGDVGERVALQHEDFLVVAVGNIEVALLRVLREADVPHRSVAERCL